MGPAMPMTSDPEVFDVWVIYERPSDHPEHYILRKQSVASDGRIRAALGYFKASDVEQLRKIVRDELGLTCLCRADADEPQILETWI